MPPKHRCQARTVLVPGARPPMPADMSEQTIALVTGANKGIGYEIAAGLGALGWSVGIGARDRERGPPWRCAREGWTPSPSRSTSPTTPT